MTAEVVVRAPRLVVLESPFRGANTLELERNISYARACVRDCALRGEAVQASHLLYTQDGILDDTTTRERELGIYLGSAWRRVADMTVFYTDHGWSVGMLEAFRGVLADGLEYRIRAISGVPELPHILPVAPT